MHQGLVVRTPSPFGKGGLLRSDLGAAPPSAHSRAPPAWAGPPGGSAPGPSGTCSQRPLAPRRTGGKAEPPRAPGAPFSPNKVAASEALRLNWDSRNLGPNVDMLAMSVASVAPARQSRMNVGFFRSSQTELGDGAETRGRGGASGPGEPTLCAAPEPRLRGGRSGRAPQVCSTESGGLRPRDPTPGFAACSSRGKLLPPAMGEPPGHPAGEQAPACGEACSGRGCCSGPSGGHRHQAQDGTGPRASGREGPGRCGQRPQHADPLGSCGSQPSGAAGGGRLAQRRDAGRWG